MTVRELIDQLESLTEEQKDDYEVLSCSVQVSTQENADGLKTTEIEDFAESK